MCISIDVRKLNKKTWNMLKTVIGICAVSSF